MFENPLRKYAAGGVTSAQEQKLVQIFSKAASKLNIKPKVLIQKVQELSGEQQIGFVQAIQDIADNENPKPESIQLIQSVFAQPSQAFREGGKIHDFICKHANGGALKGCGCKQEGGSIWGNPYTDSLGSWRNFHFPEGGFAGTVDMNTGRAYKAETNEEMLQPGRYNRKGYPMPGNASTNGTWYEVNPYGSILVNIPEGGQQVLHGNDSTAVANLIKQWDQSKVGHATTEKENGGTVEMGKDGMSKVEALRKAKEIHGYNDSQARFAYTNAKKALRSQGLYGRELRQSAREMISRDARQPIVAIDSTSSMQDVAVATLPDGSLLPVQTIVGSREPRMGNNYDNLTFSNAFLAARNKTGGDNGIFNWRGGRYTTRLANSSKEKNNTDNTAFLNELPNLEPVVIEDPEMTIPVYDEPLATGIRIRSYFKDPQKYNYHSYHVKFNPFIKDIPGLPLQTVMAPQMDETRAGVRDITYRWYKNGGKVKKAQNGESKLGDSKKEKDRQIIKQNLEKAKKTSDAIKESHKTSDSGWKYNWAWERILNGRNGKWVNGTVQEIYHTGVNGVHGTLDTREGDSLLTGYPVLRTIGKQDVMNGEPGWDLARDKWFEILRSNRTTPYAEYMQNNLDRERINHPKPKKDEQGGKIEKAQKGKSKLSTPVTTQPKDSTQVEYILNFPGKNGKETVAFTDANGNDIAWSHNRRDDTYSWSHAGERMRFNPNQNDGFIPYSSFKQQNTGIEGSTYLSPEDAEKLKVLFEYAKNYRRPRDPKYSWDSSIAERFWYMLKDKAVTQPPAGTPTLKEQLFRKNGGKVEKAQDGNIIDYYKDKWSNDLNRVRQGWNRFRESAPGRVWGAFMPNPNSEAGMLGAAAPVGKISSLGKAASKIDDEVKVLGYYDELGNFIKTEGDDLARGLEYNIKSKLPEYELPEIKPYEPDYSSIDFNNLVTPHADLGDWIGRGIIGGALGGAAYAGAKMAESETKDKKKSNKK